MSDLPDPTAQAGEYEAVLDALEARDHIYTAEDRNPHADGPCGYVGERAGEMILPRHIAEPLRSFMLHAGSYTSIEVWIETPEDRAARERGETLARALKASR